MLEGTSAGGPRSKGAPKGAILCLVACLVGAAGPARLDAGQERYDYDALGRLVRVIDEQGRVTQYVYDPAGNILQVITGGTAEAPAITSIDPPSINRGDTVAVTVNGSGLANSQLSVGGSGLAASGIQISASQATFTLAAALDAALGPQQIGLSNAAGTASTTITVNPLVPKLGMAPQPIALLPSSSHNFLVTLSAADGVDHAVTLASANTAIATVTPSATISAGQTEVVVTVNGLAAGTTNLGLSSPGLASTSVPVFVSTEAAGLNTNFAKPVGVVLQAASGPAIRVSPLATSPVGVVTGAYIDHLAPTNFGIGTGPTDLVISGNELGGVTAASIAPGDGVTLGAIGVAPDGHSVTVPITVASNAPTTSRKVVLAGAQQPYVAARPGADQILVTLPPPQILSISPLFAATGTVGMTLKIQGGNLQRIQAVTLAPGAGISVDAFPSASSDGTAATVKLSVDPLAPTGSSVVVVTTPGGASTATANAANTFTVVNQIEGAITPVASPLLGVVLQSPNPPTTPTSVFSSIVGLAVGPVVTGVAPAVGIIGQTTQITLSGSELQGVTAVQLSPSDGVTLDTPVASADGGSVTVNATIASDAPQTIRALKVLAGTAAVPFANALAAEFRVSAPPPVLQSVTPNYLLTGAAASTLTIRGLNFRNASSVGMVPPEGISINNPPAVDSAGTQITVNMSAAAGAATGPRAVTVTTPGGTSSTALAPENTVTITNSVGSTITPVISPNLGVVLQDATPPPPISVGPFVAPAVGVVLQDSNPPPAPTTFTVSPNVGVAVGPIATGASASPLYPGASGTLTISGFALNDVTGVSIVPADNVTLGALAITPDGSQISVPITLDASAATGLRGVQVLRGTTPVPFAPPGADTFLVGVAPPTIDSITPILASRGTTFTMTIRGHNFQGVIAVTATPGTGMFIDSSPVASTDGTIVTLQIGIAADAPLESKVIQVITPAGATQPDAVPANTFTVEP